MKTKYTDFQVSTAMKYSSNIEADKLIINKEKKYIDNKLIFKVKKNKSLIITKYISVLRKKNYKDKNLNKEALRKVNYAYQRGFNSLLQDNNNTWQDIWQISDIKIDGDVAAQQGIRFNIFQLYQSYTGFDPELNISPKGLSGEKYGGTTYWDTEAFCLPFYLLIGEKNVARNLLLYRYKHLEKARENASKLGLKGALYPMVTMNGEECHNEWEITFEEIHRNAAIAYAIYDYVKYTEDKKYLLEYGFKVLLEIARFWADRVQYQSAKDKYMILGVTGPNEYENNVNNNWYTNRMVSWTLEYTLKVNKYIKKHYPLYHSKIFNKINIQVSELNKWQEIKEKMYYPMIKEPDLFAQQDGFTDKKIISTDSLSDKELPLHKNWSWDKILRSPYIKQADVLQGLYFLGDKYSKETKRKNFDYYEKLTVHESSLSPSIHSIIASEIACYHKAYKYYLQSARLDLENYNKDTEDGLHITSMGGSWLAITKGFAGMKTKDNILSFSPYLPDNWKSYSFKIKFRKRLLLISINTSTIIINLKKGKKLNINIYNQIYLLKNKIEININ